MFSEEVENVKIEFTPPNDPNTTKNDEMERPVAKTTTVVEIDYIPKSEDILGEYKLDRLLDPLPKLDDVKIEFMSPEDSDTTTHDEVERPIAKTTILVDIGCIPKSEITLDDYQLDETPIQEKRKFNEAFVESVVGNKREEKIHAWGKAKKNIACDECGSTFLHKNSIVRHFTSQSCSRKKNKKSYTGERPFACIECEKTFSVKGHLHRHKRNHTGERPFACEECEMKFRRKESLRRHKITHSAEKLFACEECEKKFSRKDHLHRHKRIHTGEKPFDCEECKMKFRLKRSLQQHKKKHTGEKLFACKDCEKKYSRKDHLRRHQIVHTDQKSFVCEVCEKKFSRKDHLRRHQIIHTDHANSCEECNLKFRRKHRHKGVHANEKSFTCDECKMKFRLKKSLQQHKTKHTGEKRFVCNECGFAFFYKGNLERHFTAKSCSRNSGNKMNKNSIIPIL